MNKLLLALSLLASGAAYPSTAYADEEAKSVAYLDYQQAIAIKPDRFKLDLCGAYYDHSYMRLFSCLNARPGYAESYVGPALVYTFLKDYPGDETGEIQMGVGFGFEAGKTEKFSERVAGYARIRYEPVFLYFLGETGGSGPRYRAEADVKIHSRFTVGAFYENRDGMGPRAGFFIPEYLMNLWIAPLYDFDGKKMNYVAGVHGAFW